MSVEPHREAVELVHRPLVKAGFEAFAVDDGGEDLEPVTSQEAVVDAVLAVWEAWVHYRRKGATASAGSVWLVLVNDPWETVTDWRYSKGDPDGFDAALEEASTKLEQVLGPKTDSTGGLTVYDVDAGAFLTAEEKG